MPLQRPACARIGDRRALALRLPSMRPCVTGTHTHTKTRKNPVKSVSLSAALDISQALKPLQPEVLLNSRQVPPRREQLLLTWVLHDLPVPGAGLDSSSSYSSPERQRKQSHRQENSTPATPCETPRVGEIEN